MFPRIKTYLNKDGSRQQYLCIVANKKIDGKVKQITVANLGRIEEVQPNLGQLIEGVAKFSKEIKVINLADEIKTDWSKEYGLGLIYWKVWDEMGLGKTPGEIYRR